MLAALRNDPGIIFDWLGASALLIAAALILTGGPL